MQPLMGEYTRHTRTQNKQHKNTNAIYRMKRNACHIIQSKLRTHARFSKSALAKKQWATASFLGAAPANYQPMY